MKQKEIKKIVSTLRTRSKRVVTTHDKFIVCGKNVYAVLKNKKNPPFFVLHKLGKKSKQQVAVDYVHNIVFYLDRNMDGNQCIAGYKAHNNTKHDIVYSPCVLSEIKVMDHDDCSLTVPAKDVPSRYIDQPTGEIFYNEL